MVTIFLIGLYFVNQLGGMRLYDDFAKAVSGELEDALDLLSQALRSKSRSQREIVLNFLARIRVMK